jgi:hypothetical protein
MPTSLVKEHYASIDPPRKELVVIPHADRPVSLAMGFARFAHVFGLDAARTFQKSPVVDVPSFMLFTSGEILHVDGGAHAGKW